MNESIKMCIFCEEQICTKSYKLYSLWVQTKQEEWSFIGILKLIEEISNYAMQKGYHLFGSQIILTRDDIVLEFLKTKYVEVLDFYLEKCDICDGCFEELKLIVPLM